ncbi:uncharacterized protein BDR25DRAFT_20893 [Lindgomyces ingoldianus]|uniref:Uncharacterized protein n=1 Tax=Lindgomyces ingoldianus TaxID=673940 RepID=A0ACB6QWZ5_9PLEO|nr:uncharacterized protein BDR25DRAFT_20893 [Lindgomyces ingoldianus]KAF2471538.1 hypothetical protein BDR25DRAFT_20893 [Lindgomyces ingoldianus]
MPPAPSHRPFRVPAHSIPYVSSLRFASVILPFLHWTALAAEYNSRRARLKPRSESQGAASFKSRCKASSSSFALYFSGSRKPIFKWVDRYSNPSGTAISAHYGYRIMLISATTLN